MPFRKEKRNHWGYALNAIHVERLLQNISLKSNEVSTILLRQEGKTGGKTNKAVPHPEFLLWYCGVVLEDPDRNQEPKQENVEEEGN
jgi:hypothetical protein